MVYVFERVINAVYGCFAHVVAVGDFEVALLNIEESAGDDQKYNGDDKLENGESALFLHEISFLTASIVLQEEREIFLFTHTPYAYSISIVQNEIMAAALLALLAAATTKQVWDIKKGGKAAPLSFLIWTLVNIVSVSAQLATQPALMALILPFGQLASMGIIFIYAVKTSRNWGSVGGSQRAAILLCIAGLGAWVLMRDPMYAIAGNVIANIAGVLPTWEQAWKRPHTLSRGYWMIEGGTVAVGLLVVLLHAPLHIASLVPQLTGVFICWTILGVQWVRLNRKKVLLPEKQADLL